MSGAHMIQKQPQHVSLRTLIIVVTIVFIIVIAAAGFFAMQFFALKSDSNIADDETTQRIIGKVDGLYVLPEGQPTVARVEDKDKLGSQAFFAQVQNGDYLVVYSEAKLALLYREAVNKLVNVGPIALDNALPDGMTDPAKLKE
jgi:hypothetical protein